MTDVELGRDPNMKHYGHKQLGQKNIDRTAFPKQVTTVTTVTHIFSLRMVCEQLFGEIRAALPKRRSFVVSAVSAEV